MGKDCCVDELAMVEWLRTTLPQGSGVILGPGDDCALLDVSGARELAVTTDTLLEGTHFLATDDAELVGWKTAAVSVSDLAAMGCRPQWAVTGAGLRRGTDEAWLRGFVAGLSRCARLFGMGLVGGDITSWDHPASFTLTAFGSPWPGGPVRRSGARPGDILAVTGSLGGSFPDRHLCFLPRVEESRRLCASGAVTAMMDLSDGLALDLRRLCAMSGVGVTVDAAHLPVSTEARDQAKGDPEAMLRKALCDGEDFELVFAVRPDAWDALATAWDHATPITRIGVFTSGRSRTLRCGDGDRPLPEGGYVHAIG